MFRLVQITVILTVALLLSPISAFSGQIRFDYEMTNREIYREIKLGNDSRFEDVRSSFIRPNERTPEQLPPILDELTEGGYLTVGTERGFMTTAMLPKITDVFLVDRVPEVVLYNRLNIDLLKMARNHSDYVHLRTKATVAELSLRFLRSNRKFTLGQIKWFVEVLRYRDGADKLMTVQSALVSGTNRKAPPTISLEANYVLNPELGLRLMKLAKEDRLNAYLLDFADTTSVESFRDKVIRPRLEDKSLALIDVSNAWWSEYMGKRRFGRLLKTLTDKNSPTLAIGTSLSDGDWFYLTFMARDAHITKRWSVIERALEQIDLNKLRNPRKQKDFSEELVTSYLDTFRVSANAIGTCESLFLPTGRLGTDR